jgi:hypothetical protein
MKHRASKRINVPFEKAVVLSGRAESGVEAVVACRDMEEETGRPLISGTCKECFLGSLLKYSSKRFAKDKFVFWVTKNLEPLNQERKNVNDEENLDSI